MEHDQKEFNTQQEEQQPQMDVQAEEIDDMQYFTQLLKHLRANVERANRIPMSNLGVINVATFLTIIEELEKNLPDAIQCGMQMYSEKDRLLGEAETTAMSRVSSAELKANMALEKARRDADQIIMDARDEAQGIIEDAEERAAYMVSESEVVAQARDEAHRIKSDARVAANELQYKVSHDVQRMMAKVEEHLNETLKGIHNLQSTIEKDDE